MKEINNNLQESLVSFSIAKLLKEKGFLVACLNEYNSKGNLRFEEYPHTWVCRKYYKDAMDIYSAPTQQLAIDWIKVNWNIHIIPITYKKCNGKYDCLLIGDNIENESLMLNLRCGWFFKSEKAKEAAILHTLTHLI